MKWNARLRVPATAAMAALLGVLVLALPQCRVNELGHGHAERTGDLHLGPAPRAGQDARFRLACPAAPDPAGSPILRAPYVQDVGPSAAEILWTSDALADPVVAVSAQGRPLFIARAADDLEAPLPRGRQYHAHLRGLAAATTYCYEVLDGDRRLAGPFGFTTAPLPGSGAPIRLVALGDMGYRSTDQRAVLEQMSRVEFDLALLAGDIAYTEGSLAELEYNFLSVYAPLMRSAPFYPASGNHDYGTDDAAPFRQVFALPENGGPAGRERWYSFDRGDLHVVVLDSEKLGPDQTEWLDRDLDRTSSPWVIALFHRAPYSSGEHGPDLPTRAAFAPILARHRVTLVISGHEHDYERFRPRDGVTYVVSGGGGRGTRRIPGRAEGSVLALQVAHFLYIVVERDRLRLWAIDASGQTFDTLELVRDGQRAG